MKDPITTNLADFGWCELREVRDLLSAMIDQGLPEDFHNDQVHPMLNRNSGNVFLTNSDYQVAMLNGKDLESFYTCWNCGNEGFAEDCKISECGQYCCNCRKEETEEEAEESEND